MRDDDLSPAELLSRYLDGDLGAGSVAELEAQLKRQPELRQLLTELGEVRHRARNLTDSSPERDLWSRIEAGLDPERPNPGGPLRQDETRAQPQRSPGPHPGRWLRIAAVLALLLGGGWTVGQWWAGRMGGDSASRTRLLEARLAGVTREFEAERPTLAPGTVTLVDRGVVSLDRAIHQASEALVADPDNRLLQDHLAYSLERKLRYLEQAGSYVKWAR